MVWCLSSDAQYQASAGINVIEFSQKIEIHQLIIANLSDLFSKAFASSATVFWLQLSRWSSAKLSFWQPHRMSCYLSSDYLSPFSDFAGLRLVRLLYF